MNRESNSSHLDKQVKHLAGRLRETGTAPSRDLWPDIDAALDKVDQRVDQDLKTAGSPWRIWRLAALAATLALILGLGYLGNLDQPTLDPNLASDQGVPEVASVTSEPNLEPTSALKKLADTLHELNDALSLDPENRNLSRLVLLVHKSRADILRQNTQGRSSLNL